MRTLPPEPKPGDKVSANLLRDIIRAIRERTPICGPGIKLACGPNGTVFSASPVVSRGGSSYADMSCFRLGTIETEEDTEETDDEDEEETDDEDTEETVTETHPAIVCCYYNVGGVTMHMDDVDIIDLIPEDPEEGEEAEVKIICFKLTGTDPSIVAIDPDDLSDEQRDSQNYVYPLYRYEGSTVTADLRNALNVQYYEGELT